jgi:nucleoid-associated protein YgaU
MGNPTDKADFSDMRSGVQPTPKEAPEARPDFSDVTSKVTSTLDETALYEVKAGDNLSQIARHFYGQANQWKAIFEANRDQLSDPDRIKPGQMLQIPPKP